MHVYIYRTNFLVDLSCRVTYEVIILSEPFLTYLIFVYPSPHLLWQSRHSLNTDAPSSADLTCFAIKKTLLLTHLKQVYNEFSKVFCGF